MKIYIPEYSHHAGHWIYRGYQRAWKELGYDLAFNEATRTAAGTVDAAGYEHFSVAAPYPSDEVSMSEEYIIMAVDGAVKSESFLESIERSHKTFLFAQPNSFPDPWGGHPNFVCLCEDETIEKLNKMDNVHLWTFGEVGEHHSKWKNVHTIPLAFDSIGYKAANNDAYKKYDISFVGGWVDNGFNEKRPIMIDIFSKFMNSGLNCGFFVGRGLTHQQECEVLCNSKITLNIHDTYQRVLGNDTNERSFKSLGLNGLLVSDTVRQLNSIFPNVKTSLDSDELVQITKDYLSLTEKELNDIKEENKQNILENHCYTNRVQQMLDL